MRTKDEIDRDIEANTKNLDYVIEKALKDEQDFEVYCKDIKYHIKTLKAEKPYEATPAGQIDILVIDAEKKIKILIDELKQKTGVNFNTPKIQIAGINLDESDS